MWREMLAADQQAARGEWEEAATILIKLSSEAPSNFLLQEKAAMALERAGRWAEASERWYAFSFMAQKRSDVLIRLAKCDLMRDRVADASKILSAVAILLPEALEARFLQAVIVIHESKEGNPARHLQLLSIGQMGTMLFWISGDAPLRQNCLGPDRTRILARWILGGGTEMAAPDAPGAEPDADSLRRASDTLSRLEQAMQANDPPLARACIKEARAIGATGPFLEAYTAYLDMAEGKEAAARDTLSRLMGIHPDSLSLHHFLGVMLLDHDRFADAVEPLRIAVTLSQHRADILFAYACALAGSNRQEEALLQLKSLARRSPARAYSFLTQNAPALNSLRRTRAFEEWFATLAPSVSSEAP